MKFRHSICLVVYLTILAGCSNGRKSAELEYGKLEGTWLLVYQESNGQKLPDEKTAEMFHGKMVFKGRKIHYSAELPGFDFAFNYELRPAKVPKEVDLEIVSTSDEPDAGHKSFGIYTFEDGKLKICHNPKTVSYTHLTLPTILRV